MSRATQRPRPPRRPSPRPLVGALALGLAVALACSSPRPSARDARSREEAVYQPAPRSKERGCAARGPLPDAACTPGGVMTGDRAVVCGDPTRDRRHVAASVHRQAFLEYGLPDAHEAGGAYEVDHLIPLGLGGDNTIANLWAEASEPRPGFHEKDAVEDYLHDQVCAGAMSLADAQRAIATDWLAVYQQMSGPLLRARDERNGD